MSLRAPTADATTGTPQAIAASAALPDGSCTGLHATTSADRSSGRQVHRQQRNRIKCTRRVDAQLLGEVPQPTGLRIRVQVMRFGLADHDQLGLRNHCHRTHQGVESLVAAISLPILRMRFSAPFAARAPSGVNVTASMPHRNNRDPVSRSAHSASARTTSSVDVRRHPVSGLRHHRPELYAAPPGPDAGREKSAPTGSPTMSGGQLRGDAGQPAVRMGDIGRLRRTTARRGTGRRIPCTVLQPPAAGTCLGRPCGHIEMRYSPLASRPARRHRASARRVNTETSWPQAGQGSRQLRRPCTVARMDTIAIFIVARCVAALGI